MDFGFFLLFSAAYPLMSVSRIWNQNTYINGLWYQNFIWWMCAYILVFSSFSILWKCYIVVQYKIRIGIYAPEISWHVSFIHCHNSKLYKYINDKYVCDYYRISFLFNMSLSLYTDILVWIIGPCQCNFFVVVFVRFS